jgi:RNA polymerase sigma-70 factor (ECF subfamily)
MEENLMTKINLREYYPFYTSDCFIDVPEEVAALMRNSMRYEDTYQRRMYRNKAFYSLDRDDGIEHDVLFVALSPFEIYERKVTYEQLHTAVSSLPDKQAKRIYAHYFVGMSKTAIARSEGVNVSQVSRSIRKALINIERGETPMRAGKLPARPECSEAIGTRDSRVLAVSKSS